MSPEKSEAVFEPASEKSLIKDDLYLSEMADRLHRLRALMAQADAPKGAKTRKIKKKARSTS